MTDLPFDRRYGGTAAENYQRFFVPSIGQPLAEDLIGVARLRPGERVLDVACGTGVVTRLAAERVGAGGSVAGLDVNPGMLAVARAETPPDIAIDWHEASADAMPFPDESFDVVLCQMGLQFVPEKRAAMREMFRVLKPGGRAYVSLPGPKPAMFGILTDALTSHLGPPTAAFVDLVFSMHGVDELTDFMRSAGFREVDVQARSKDLRLPAPGAFLWQYIHSTPLSEAVKKADRRKLDALEHDVCTGWQAFAADDGLIARVGITTGSAIK